jgi:hypothetical protein
MQSQRKTKVVRPKPINVKVHFLVDCDPQDGKPVFKAGSVHELPAPSANHWIRRGKAEKYIEPVPRKEPAPEKPKYGGKSKTKVKSSPTVEKKTDGDSGEDQETPMG